MKKNFKKLPWIGAIFMFITVIIFGYAVIITSHFDSYQALVDERIDLISDTSFNQEFIVEKGGRYFVDLNFKKTENFSNLKCQLDISNDDPNLCVEEDAF